MESSRTQRGFLPFIIENSSFIITYLHDPELLQLVSPEKYEFMQQEMFSGREYPQVHADWDYDSAGNKEVCG